MNFLNFLFWYDSLVDTYMEWLHHQSTHSHSLGTWLFVSCWNFMYFWNIWMTRFSCQRFVICNSRHLFCNSAFAKAHFSRSKCAVLLLERWFLLFYLYKKHMIGETRYAPIWSFSLFPFFYIINLPRIHLKSLIELLFWHDLVLLVLFICLMFLSWCRTLESVSQISLIPCIAFHLCLPCISS